MLGLKLNRVSKRGHWCFLWCKPERAVEQSVGQTSLVPWRRLRDVTIMLTGIWDVDDLGQRWSLEDTVNLHGGGVNGIGPVARVIIGNCVRHLWRQKSGIFLGLFSWRHVIKWKNPRYWHLVRGIHRSPVDSPLNSHKPVTRIFDVFVQTIETPVIWDAIALIMTSL